MGRRSTSAATLTRQEAARACDATVRAQSLGMPLNFPDDLSTAPGVYVPKKKKRVASSRFRGVSWNKTKQRWRTIISIAGKNNTVGSNVDETEAARAYDAAVRAQSLDRPLNFPDDLSTASDVFVLKKKKRVESSRFRGVSWDKAKSEVEDADQYRGKEEAHRQLRRRDGSSTSVRRHCSSAAPQSAAQPPRRSLYCI